MTKTLKEVMDENFKYMPPDVKGIIGKIIKHIGIKTGDALNKFLNLSIKDFNHPHNMKELKESAQYILEVAESGGKIIFYGDYDADGVTATALFVTVMKELGYEVDYFVPSRYKEGYGVDAGRVEEFQTYDLIVTGDTGIREFESIKSSKIPVIVTDHHDPVIYEKKEDIEKLAGIADIIEKDGMYMAIPKAKYVVNPKRIDCEYQNEGLAGVGVIFKLAQALYMEKGYDQKGLLTHLDLVAIGSVADLVPQFDKKNQNSEVRLMTAIGLQVLNQDRKAWGETLLNITGKMGYKYNDLGFFLGPILNAPGRMNDATIAVDFLLEEDPGLNYELGEELVKINEERKEKQKKALESIEVMPKPEDKFFAARLPEEFGSGITGLVSGGICNNENIPTVIFSDKGNGTLSASCRSIEGVDLMKYLHQVEKGFGSYKYGGHEQAAGLSIKEEDYDRFVEVCKRVFEKIEDELFERTMNYEVEVPLDVLDPSIIFFLEQSFHKVRFLSKKNELYTSPTTLKKNPNWVNIYLKNGNTKHKAVSWVNGEQIINNYINGVFKDGADIVYTPTLWDGGISITVESISPTKK